MKKNLGRISLYIFIILIVIGITLFGKTIRPAAIEDNLSYYTTTSLNVRSGPGVTYDKLGVLKKNTQVEVLELSNGWYKINFNGNEAYVSAKYVKTNLPVVSEPVNAIFEGEDREFAVALFDRVNEYRESIGVNKLTWSDDLYNVAFVRAKEISTLWSHTRPNGTDPGTAFKENGVSYKIASENLLRYANTVEDAFNTWYNSSGHKSTMENGSLNKVAVYVFRAEDGKVYIAEEFTD